MIDLEFDAVILDVLSAHLTAAMCSMQELCTQLAADYISFELLLPLTSEDVNLSSVMSFKGNIVEGTQFADSLIEMLLNFDTPQAFANLIDGQSFRIVLQELKNLVVDFSKLLTLGGHSEYAK